MCSTETGFRYMVIGYTYNIHGHEDFDATSFCSRQIMVKMKTDRGYVGDSWVHFSKSNLYYESVSSSMKPF